MLYINELEKMSMHQILKLEEELINNNINNINRNKISEVRYFFINKFSYLFGVR